MTTSLAGMAKAAIIALALGTGTVAGTVPAQAQGFSFNFGFGTNNDGPFDSRPHRICLTDSQLRRAISDQGYHDVRLNVEMHNRIQIRATRGDWIYLLDVVACSGRILDRERLRRS